MPNPTELLHNPNFRRNTVRVVSALPLAGTVFGIACNTTEVRPNPQLTSRPAITIEATVSPDQLDVSAWRKQPLALRRRQLEFLQIPTTEEFDKYKEMSIVVAELFCQDGIFTKNPQQLQDSIRIVNGDELLEQARKEAIRPINETEAAKFRDLTFEIVGNKERFIYLNQQFIEAYGKRELERNPNITAQLQGKNITMMAMEVILFHAYSHASRTDEAFDITPLEVTNGNTNTVDYTFTRFEGFGLSGRRLDGSPTRFGNEGLAELVAKIKAGPGNYPVLTKDYADATALTDALNRKAGMTSREVMEYFMGKKGPDSGKQFLARWASIKNAKQPNQNDAIQALMAVEMRSHGNITQQEATRAIQGYLGNSALQLQR